MLKIFALFDRVSRGFGEVSLALASTEEACKRSLADASAQRGSALYQHRGDFDLHCLGTFDPESGQIFPVVGKTFVCTLSELVSGPPIDGIGMGTQMEAPHGA